jgi:hypothetical protein
MYGNDFMKYKEIRDALNAEVVSDEVVDVVNSPPHYTAGGIEAIDAIKAAVATAPPVQAVFVANILKYVWRYREKNGKQDLMKARWYLDALIQEVESKSDNEKS